jgi:hypothetical protein
MKSQIRITEEMVTLYSDLFINRLAYTVQSSRPDPRNGRHYYYRPRKGKNEEAVPLTRDTIRQHLEGRITIGIYAINPETQRSKWVAIDADYTDALADLLKLQWELRQDGVESALEKSRRGAHLWVFADKPLLARDCRIYIHHLAARLSVPMKTGGQVDGIELFPRQDRVEANEFGNAMRGPLGVHRGAGKRFWFYGADYQLAKQLEYLCRLRRITELELNGFIRDVTTPEELAPKSKPVLPPYDPKRREFNILDHIAVRRKRGRNWVARCPSCALRSRDTGGDNLAISVADPRKYCCWAGCPKEMIREALGCPIWKREGTRYAR